MRSQTVVIKNPSGLHARPAAVFSKAAGGFESKVSVTRVGSEDKQANAKSVLALMAMGLGCGTEVVISADGPDEDKAVQDLVALIEEGCGE